MIKFRRTFQEKVSKFKTKFQYTVEPLVSKTRPNRDKIHIPKNIVTLKHCYLVWKTRQLTEGRYDNNKHQTHSSNEYTLDHLKLL